MTTPRDVATAFSSLSGQAVLEVRQLSGGSSNPSWRVTTKAGVYATRLYNTPLRAFAQRQLLHQLARDNFLVPKVVFSGIYGAHYLLALGWVQGLTMAEALQTQPDRAQQLGQLFGEVHARLHTTNPSNA